MNKNIIPGFEGVDVVYKSAADNKDIRDLLISLVPKATNQMKNFALEFSAKTQKETCKKIFDYLKNNFIYHADADEQIIKLPSALLAKRVGDCKSYSLFTAAILENLKIPYTFVYASYNNNPIPGHVYVQTECCIIDAVYGIFNKEKKPIYKYYSNMNVRYMAGIGCTNCKTITSTKQPVALGNIFTKAADAIKSAAQSVATGAKNTVKKVETGAQNTADVIKQKGLTVALAPGRALMLLIIKNNVDGIASSLAKNSTSNFADKWYNLGGNRTTLVSTISQGASRPAKNMGFLSKLKSILKSNNISGMGDTALSSAAQESIMTLCTGVATAIGGPTAAPTGAAFGTVVISVLPSLIPAANATPNAIDSNAHIPQLNPPIDLSNLSDTGSSNTSSNSDIMTNVIKYGPFALLAGFGIYYIVKKK